MQREGSGYLVLLQHICSTKEESDIFLLWRSVFNFIGMATGLREAKEWIEREKRDRLWKTDGLRNTKSTMNTTNTTITTTESMITIITIMAYCNNKSTNHVFNANLLQYLHHNYTIITIYNKNCLLHAVLGLYCMKHFHLHKYLSRSLCACKFLGS